MKVDWISNWGGPLLCASVSCARSWRGAHGSSIGVRESDYERACRSTDSVSTVRCDRDEVLVLGESSLQSSFVHAKGGLVIARWLTCLSQAVASSALKALPASLPNIERSLRFSIGAAGLLMFDSAAEGTKARESLVTDAAVGTVMVTTEKYHSPGRFEFLIHRFVPVNWFA